MVPIIRINLSGMSTEEGTNSFPHSDEALINSEESPGEKKTRQRGSLGDGVE